MSLISAIKWERIPGFRPPEGKVFDEHHGIWIEKPKRTAEDSDGETKVDTPPRNYYESKALTRPEAPAGFDAALTAEVTLLYSDIRRLKADLRELDKEIQYFMSVRDQMTDEPERSMTQELLRELRLKRINEHLAPVQKKRTQVAAELSKFERRYASLSQRLQVEARKYAEHRLKNLADAFERLQETHDELEALSYCCDNAGLPLSPKPLVCEFFTRGGVRESGKMRWYHQIATPFLRWRKAVRALGYLA